MLVKVAPSLGIFAKAMLDVIAVCANVASPSPEGQKRHCPGFDCMWLKW
jgi:hypothetical protein